MMRIAVFSTDDLSRPRNAILLDGLRIQAGSIPLFNKNAWVGYNDKSHIRGLSALCFLALRYLYCYFCILFSYSFSKRNNIVYVPYMGLFDVLLLWPFATLRRERIVWDAFISLHETVVDDRKLLPAEHLLSRALFRLEQLAIKAASLILLDTQANADFFCKYYHCPRSKVSVVPIGAHSRCFTNLKKRSSRNPNQPITVVYFGTYIPLHGVETIYRAAEITPPEIANWLLIGQGQMLHDLQQRWPDGSLANVERVSWMPHAELLQLIDSRSDICLGVFGNSAKATRIVPNKVYESIARGLPVITLDCEPVRELLPKGTPGAWLVPGSDPQALSDAVIKAASELHSLRETKLFESQVSQITPDSIGTTFINCLKELR